MFCIVMLIVLLVLSIFSASSRSLVREAFECVTRRVTLRPCVTGFDEKMKARILGSVLSRSETAARLLNRNFELLSWTFFLLFLASAIWVVRGGYLFYVTGSCSGLNRDSFCVFDPKGASNQVSLTGSCPIRPKSSAGVSLKGVDLTKFPALKGVGPGTIVMIGCYGCSYSRTVYPMLKDLAVKSGSSFVFIDYPVTVGSDLMTRLGSCVYRADQAKYWKLNDRLFRAEKAKLEDPAYAAQAASDLGLGAEVSPRCLQDPATENAVSAQLNEAAKTGFFGTPTVFINGRPYVGPKPPRVYAIALQGPLYWLE